ncbi:MAG: CDP-glucose 4,6-dehydratase [Acidobacteriota bacterium]
MTDRAFWRGRRVFLTGHTGFKGSWATLWLRHLGAEVVGYALDPPSEPNLWRLLDLGDEITDLRGDIRNGARTARAIADAAPEIVLHFAAQSLVREGYKSPVDTYAINVMGTAHVLEAVRAVDSVRAVVVVTTDKCYDNREWVWPYRENEAMGGKDPYSSSKGCAELVTAAYRDSFFSSPDTPMIASARAGNVIGGGDWATDRLLPDLMRGALSGEPVHIRSPHAVRPWQHVLEPIAGYLRLAEALCGDDGATYAEGWNFGPVLDDAKSVGWIVRHIAKRCDASSWPGLEWREDPGPHPPEAHTLKLDSSKAAALLDWRPRLRLGTALDWTAEWFAGYRDEVDVRALSENQVLRYQEFV